MAACEEIIRIGNRWHGSRNACGKPAKMEYQGHHYCGMHDPVKREARRKAVVARWDEEGKAASVKRRLEAAAPEMLAALEFYMGAIPYMCPGLDLLPGQRAIAKARGEA